MLPYIQSQLLKIVKDNYDFIALEFSQTREYLYWNNLNQLLEKYISKDAFILDVGCGNGRILESLKNKKIQQYIGIDQSLELVKKAQERYGQNKNFNFKQGDILKINDLIIPSSFDFILFIAVLHHIPSKSLQLEILKQLKEKLKPNGKLILTVWNMWSKSKFKKIILKSAWQKIIGRNKMDFGDILFDWKDTKSKRYYHAFTFYGLKKICKKAGFKIYEAKKDKDNYYLILC